MSKEMTAVEYLKAKARMTDDCYCECKSKCLLTRAGLKYDDNCHEFECKHPEEAVDIVQKWAEQHPVNTRQSEILKIYPNAKIQAGVVKICPRDLNTDLDCRGNSERISCDTCRKDYWLQEVE